MLGVVLIGIGAFADLPPIGTGITLAIGTIALLTGTIGFCPVLESVRHQYLSDGYREMERSRVCRLKAKGSDM